MSKDTELTKGEIAQNSFTTGYNQGLFDGKQASISSLKEKEGTMEWEKTIMPIEELALLKAKHVKMQGEERPDIRDFVFAALKRQTEITGDIAYKAGYIEGQSEKGHNEAILLAVQVAKKEGMREVVSFAEDNIVYGKNVSIHHISIDGEKWQAFLKEKGVE